MDELNADGRQTILDVGITYPLIDTYLTNKSTVERGFATNAYGNRKDKDYGAIINLHYKSVTFGTFGSFGSGTWSVISVACDPSTHPRASDDYNPWNSPGPKRDFTLSLGFALQRANSRMLRNADKRRRLARSSGKYSSGTRPTSPDEDY